MEDIHDPTDFSNSSLQRLDRELRCAICKDLYNTPMQLTTCIHSFCALCIRRRLAQERVCPACKTPADETKMIRNSVIDECVNTWRTTARQLVISLEKSQTQSQQQQQQQSVAKKRSTPVANLESPTSSSGTRRSSRIQKSQQPHYNQVINLDDDEDRDFQQERQQKRPEVQQQQQLSSPVLQSIPPADTPSNNNERITQNSEVQCPICSQFMRQVVINEHLDRCMRGDSSIPQPPKQFLGQSASSSTSFTPPISNSSATSNTISPIMNRRDARQNKNRYGKRPVKLVYDMQKEKDLRKTLKDLGLPDHGDKQQMVWRHKEYVTLYYANLDAEHPKEGRALIQQLQEAEEGYVNGRQQSHSQLNVEEHNRKYKNEFDELIAKARKRARAQQQQSSSSSSSVNENTTPNINSSSANTSSSSSSTSLPLPPPLSPPSSSAASATENE